MIRKIVKEDGVTLIEMLAATAIIVLLVLLLNTGMNMARRSYTTLVTQSELEIMTSTIVDAVVHELRFADNVDTSNPPSDEINFIYDSPSYGKNTRLFVDEKSGHIMLTCDYYEEPVEFLSTGIYGAERGGLLAYKVDELKIHFDNNSNMFNLDIEVKPTNSHYSYLNYEVRNLDVHCLNHGV